VTSEGGGGRCVGKKRGPFTGGGKKRGEEALFGGGEMGGTVRARRKAYSSEKREGLSGKATTMEGKENTSS